LGTTALKHPKRKPRFVVDTLKNPDISADFSKAVFENLPKIEFKKTPKFNGQI